MDRITDRPDMTSAAYRGHKESTQTKKKKKKNTESEVGAVKIV